MVRFYVYSPEGAALPDHPLDGARASGVGALVTSRNGLTESRGMKIRNEVSVSTGHGERKVTVDRTVIVKVWTPPGGLEGLRERFWLIP